MTYYRTIHFSDTDAAGVVYFAALLSICYEAYENSFQVEEFDCKTFFTSSYQFLKIVKEIKFRLPRM